MNMYYSVTLGLGEYGNLIGIIFEEVTVSENGEEIRKTIKEIKRVRQDINHVNIIEDDKIIMKLYYSDNVLKKIESNETHVMSANKFQVARYNNTRDIITCQTNSSEISIDVNRGIVKEIKKIGKKKRNNKTIRISTAGIFAGDDVKINPILVKLIRDIQVSSSDKNDIYAESINDDDCCSINFFTESKDVFKKEKDLILRYAEEFLIFLNFGK